MFDAVIDVHDLLELSSLEGSCEVVVTSVRRSVEAIPGAHRIEVSLRPYPFEIDWVDLMVAGRPFETPCDPEWEALRERVATTVYRALKIPDATVERQR